MTRPDCGPLSRMALVLLMATLLPSAARADREPCPTEKNSCFMDVEAGVTQTIHARPGTVVRAFWSEDHNFLQSNGPGEQIKMHVRDNDAMILVCDTSVAFPPRNGQCIPPNPGPGTLVGRGRLVAQLNFRPDGAGGFLPDCPAIGKITGNVASWETGDVYKLESDLILVSGEGSTEGPPGMFPPECGYAMNELSLSPLD